MGFDAGTISGKLDLDTTSFNHGFQEAHTHAESEGGRIREVLESLTEVFSEALGPAVGQFAQQITSMFAGFSEGPIIGGLGAVATAVGMLRETVVDVAADFQHMGLEATKAGVSVEWMDRFANVAGTANVGLDAVGNGLKILEERAQAAADGDKKAQESFENLGISSSRLAELMKEPEKLFDAVKGSIGQMTSATERQAAAHNLLGRAGANLIPILAMSQDQFDHTADAMDRLSGGMDDSSVKMGQSMALLESYFSKAMEGIERAVAKPILAFLQAHMEEIEPKIEAVTNAIVSAIGGAWDFLASISDEFKGIAGSDIGLIDGIGTAVKSLVPLLKLLGETFAELTKVAIALFIIQIKPVVDGCGEIGKAWSSLTTAGGELNEIFNTLANSPVAAAMFPIIDAFKAIYEAVHLLGEAVSYLIDKLTALAGMKAPDPKIAATRGMSAEDAEKELKGAGVLAGDRKKPGESSTAGVTVPERSEESETTAEPEKRSARKRPAGHSAATHLADSDPDDNRPTTPSSRKAAGKSAAPAAAQPAQVEETYDQMAARISDKAANEFAAKIDADMRAQHRVYDRPDSSAHNDAFASMSPAGSAHGGSSSHRDSVSWMEPVFERLSESIDRFNSRLDNASSFGGGSSGRAGDARPVTNQYSVQVKDSIDVNKTAAAIAAVLMPAIQNLQHQRDQQLAGAMAAKAVASSMGG